jgi:signal transduction histidine kinase
MSDATTPMFSVRPLRGPILWVLEAHGRRTLELICSGADLDPDRILDATEWVPLEQAGAFLAGVRRLCADEAAFLDACAHRYREGFGPLLHVLPATTPRLMFDVACRTIPLFSNVSRGEVIRRSRTEVVMRYHSDAPALETRELCLSRSGAMIIIPEVFGLPRAVIDESACMARGDAYCEYVSRFQTRARWLPPVLGAVLGGVAAWAAAAFGVLDVLGLGTVPLSFGLLGAVWEQRSTQRANTAYAMQIQDSLRQLAEDEAGARREILAFHRRQRQWGRLMEEQVAERTGQLRQMVGHIERMNEARVSTVRGVSHDLRNPVAVLRLHHELLRRRLEDEDARIQRVLADNDEALDQMERMLSELTRSATAEAGLIPVDPGPMQIGPWVETLRRRMKALIHGKDIGVSVFRRREAPEEIVTDRLLFERVVDNLCSNAAKYTTQGSIVLELDGKPGFLTIKVSDTGPGIEAERIQRIFEPGATPDGQRAPRSLGVGLSVVVQLLAQIGGKLEVMSKVGQGTTFWAHFPTEPRDRESVDVIVNERQRLSQVVTIRKVLSS